jgi:hypothetical protein
MFLPTFDFIYLKKPIEKQAPSGGKEAASAYISQE